MKKIKLIVTIFMCMFLFASLTACKDDEQEDNTPTTDTGDGSGSGNTDDGNNTDGGNDATPVDVSKVTFTDETLEFTGEPLAITVKNLPGGVKVNYTYTLNDEEVTEMVNIGEYHITAVIVNKETGEELKTLTATLTIKEKEIVDEIEDDVDANLKLTYGTTYIQFMKNPDDETQLIAAGLELFATETIYFVLDDSTTPLNFINLHEDSLDVASKVDNTIVISEAGTYDVIMMFPEGELVPSILVREGADGSIFYFRSSINDYAATEDTDFTIDGNVASFEVELAVDDEFLISNYYYSTKFDFNPHFMYLTNFTSGGAYGTDVKVLTAGEYKFEINLITKALIVYCNNEVLVEDREVLYLRGSMNDWGTSDVLVKKNGVASIEIQLAAGDEFKIADAGWTDASQIGYGYFTNASQFEQGTDNGNVKVKEAGTYKFEVNLNQNTLTVKKDGVEIISNATSSSGGNGSTATGSYALIITHADGTTTQVSLQPWENFGEYSQHFGDNVELQAGDVIKLLDVANNADWVEKNLDPFGEYAKFTPTEEGLRCNQAGTYDFYIKFKWEDNMIYVGPANP